MATWQAFVGPGTYTTYNLSDGNPFKLLSITGVGNAPVRRLEQRGPFQDGVTDIGYRFDARIINLVIAFNASSASTADTNRDTLSDIFSPAGQNYIRLRCTRDDGEVRQIDCYAVGVVDLPAEIPERVLNYQRVAVQLKAPNPMWYDPNVNEETITGATSNALDVLTGGGIIGTANILGTVELPNVGDAMGSGTVTAGNPWTVMMRTSIDIDGDSFSYAWEASDCSFRVSSGSVQYFAPRTNASYGGTAFMTGGTQTYFWEYDGLRAYMYENGTARLEVVAGTTGTGLNVTGGYWRGTAASNDWNNTVSYAAVYNIALSDRERATLTELTAGTAALFGAVVNAGSYAEYPIITLGQDMSDPVLVNLTTGERLDFTGATISAGQSYYIDTRYGYKTVTDANATNRIAQLADASDLSTFHLEPGTNLLALYASGTSIFTSVVVQYYDRYLSL